jgi:diguanylate cyclase (GGDEF)-like protein
MLTLFYFVTFRATRSAFCLWWCWALALFLGGAGAYLMDGTELQRWTNPLGNGAIVGGAACTWAGARSLRQLSMGLWRLGAAPVVTVVVSAFDNPSTNTWSGGPVFLASMSALLGMTSYELWMHERMLGRHVSRTSTYVPVLRSMAIASALVAVYYLCRCVAFVLDGQDGPVFTTYFGSQSATLITTVLLGTVSFSMSSLSHEQQTERLRLKATRDGLTGLLNRSEFLRLAQVVTTEPAGRGQDGVIILADLDHFKSLNDSLGHAAGDVAIRAFAEACTQSVRGEDLVGRYGGEEFILFLPGVTLERAEQVTAEISDRLKAQSLRDGGVAVSASYGIAPTGGGSGIETVIGDADAALYRAKAEGRDRAVTAQTRLRHD